MNVKQLQAVEGQKRLVIVFSSGEEMVRGLTALARDQELSAAHFTGIGALSAAILGYFDVTRREYRRFGVDEQVEVLSLTGNIALEGDKPKVHAHIVVGRFNGSTLGGHLLEAHVRPTLEIVLVESPPHLRRTFDPASGLALLDLSPEAESTR
jgi:predicted DNA-binding protein with PD1-like motif